MFPKCGRFLLQRCIHDWLCLNSISKLNSTNTSLPLNAILSNLKLICITITTSIHISRIFCQNIYIYLNRIVSVWKKWINFKLRCTQYYKTACIMTDILSTDRSPRPHLQVTGTPRAMMPSVTWHSWAWFMLDKWLNTWAASLTRLCYHMAFPNHHITCSNNNCVHLHPHWIKKLVWLQL